MASFFNNLGQRIDQGIAGLYNRDQVVDLENQYTNQYGVQDTSGGVASDARHMAAMNNLSNTIAGPINNISPSLGTFIGDAGAFGLGLIPEATAALTRGFNKENFGEIGEDIVANFKGTFGTPNSATAEDIYSQVFSGAVPQRVASGTPMGYGAAQASELTDLERDFPGMSTGDIIDSMNNRQRANRFSGMGQVGPNKSNMNAPAALDMGRFSGISGFGVANEPDVEQVAQLGNPSMMQGLQSKIGSGFNNVKDFAMNKGTQGFNLARQLPGMALSAMTGIPGIGMALGLLGNMGSNEYAQATTANMQKQNNNLQGLGLDGVSNFGGVTTDDLGRITNNGLNYNTPEGIMSGYNSGFDLASSALGRIGKIQDGLALGKFKNVNKANQKINNLKTAAVASAQAKRQAYQDKIDNAKNKAAQDRARTKSITAGYGGYDNSPGATGPTAAGAGMGVGGGHAADHGFLKDGGSVGLASMFTRRR